MKCPNCSFNNPDSAEICKVCGFELQSKTSSEPTDFEAHDSHPPKRERKPHFKETDDTELDSALKTLFGSDESLDEVHEDDEFDIHIEEVPDEDDYLPKKPPFWIIGALAAALIIVFILIKLLGGNDSSSGDLTPTNITETPIIVPKDKTAEDQVNQFFTLLPTFVNQGNIAILNLFDDTESNLESLMAYAELGSIESIDGFELTPIDESTQKAQFNVVTQIERISEESSFNEAFRWEFELNQVEGQWLITYFSGLVQPDVPTTTEPTEETAEPETTAPPTTAPKTTASTEAPVTETPQARPDGFTDSGTFSGGAITDGQDIYSVRYGLHETFERLVFDIYGWTGSEPTETVDQIGVYEATVSSDGKVLTIMIEGARGAFASRNPVEFPNIDSIEYFYPGSDSAVGIRITLANTGAFKVFELKEPARLIVDYYVD